MDAGQKTERGEGWEKVRTLFNLDGVPYSQSLADYSCTASVQRGLENETNCHGVRVYDTRIYKRISCDTPDGARKDDIRLDIAYGQYQNDEERKSIKAYPLGPREQ